MNAARSRPGPRYEALLQLLRTAEALWNASRLFFARWDLSPSQFNMLNLLHDRPDGRTQIELSRSLIMHRSNVTGLVNRLAARGLLRRKTSDRDRRAYEITLTPAGQKLVRKILPHYYQAAERVWGDLPIERAQKLVAELETLCAKADTIANERRNP